MLDSGEFLLGKAPTMLGDDGSLKINSRSMKKSQKKSRRKIERMCNFWI
jgi:hypothetical protein